MTPSNRVVWLNLDDSDEVNWRKVVASGHTWFPVYRGSPDRPLGVVSVKRLWANLSLVGTASIKDLLTEPPTGPPHDPRGGRPPWHPPPWQPPRRASLKKANRQGVPMMNPHMVWVDRSLLARRGGLVGASRQAQGSIPTCEDATGPRVNKCEDRAPGGCGARPGCADGASPAGRRTSRGPGTETDRETRGSEGRYLTALGRRTLKMRG